MYQFSKKDKEPGSASGRSPAAGLSGSLQRRGPVRFCLSLRLGRGRKFRLPVQGDLSLNLVLAQLGNGWRRLWWFRRPRGNELRKGRRRFTVQILLPRAVRVGLPAGPAADMDIRVFLYLPANHAHISANSGRPAQVNIASDNRDIPAHLRGPAYVRVTANHADIAADACLGNQLNVPPDNDQASPDPPLKNQVVANDQQVPWDPLILFNPNVPAQNCHIAAYRPPSGVVPLRPGRCKQEHHRSQCYDENKHG